MRRPGSARKNSGLGLGTVIAPDVEQINPTQNVPGSAALIGCLCRWFALVGLLVAFAPWLNAQVTPGAQVTPSTEPEASRRIATLEVYYEPSNPEQRALVAAAEQFATSREGIRLRLHDLEETASSEEARAAAHQRLDKICAAGRLSAAPTAALLRQ